MDETDTDIIVCGACKRTFSLDNMAGFMKHKKYDCEDPGNSSDPKSKLLACISCRQKFESPWALLKHAQNVHFLQIFLEQNYGAVLPGGGDAQSGLGKENLQLEFSSLPSLDISSAGPQSVQQWFKKIEQEMSDTKKSYVTEGTDGATISPQKTIRGTVPGVKTSKNMTVIPVSEVVPQGTSQGPCLSSTGPLRQNVSTGKFVAAKKTKKDSSLEKTLSGSNSNSDSRRSFSRGKIFPPNVAAAIDNQEQKSSCTGVGSSPVADLMKDCSMEANPDCVDCDRVTSVLDEAAQKLFDKFSLMESQTEESLASNVSDRFSSPIKKQDMVVQSVTPSQLTIESKEPLIDSLLPSSVSVSPDNAILSLDDEENFFDTVVETESDIATTKKPDLDNSDSQSSANDSDPCCDAPNCCMREGNVCQNQNCGITVVPGTHESMKKCCSAVVPKKRKQHMVIEHRFPQKSSKTNDREPTADSGPSPSDTLLKSAAESSEGILAFPVVSSPSKVLSGDSVGTNFLETTASVTKLVNSNQPKMTPLVTSQILDVAPSFITRPQNILLPETNVTNKKSTSLTHMPLPQSSMLDSKDESASAMISVTYPLPSLTGIPANSFLNSTKVNKTYSMDPIKVDQAVLNSLGISPFSHPHSFNSSQQKENVLVPSLREATSLRPVPLTSKTLGKHLAMESCSEPDVNSTTGNEDKNANFTFTPNELEGKMATSNIEEAHSTLMLPQGSAHTCNDSTTGKKRRYPTSKPYKCDHCNSAFNQRIHLKKHLSKHTGIKPFKCDLCDYSTVERSHLKVHMRTHTGEKPFQCPHCDYATAQNSTLKIHLKRHHMYEESHGTGSGTQQPGDNSHSMVAAGTLALQKELAASNLLLPSLSGEEDILPLLPTANDQSDI